MIYLFAHNLSYDWTFLRRFLLNEFGKPKSQLNVRPHVPLTIQFNNGLVLRDSLILAGVSLDTWGKNLDIEHKKANGKNRNNRDDNDALLVKLATGLVVGIVILGSLARLYLLLIESVGIDDRNHSYCNNNGGKIQR